MTTSTRHRYLNQVLSIEQDLRDKTREALTVAHHALQKPDMLEGLSGEYEPNVDGGDELPDEWKPVQRTVKEMIEDTRVLLVRLFDATAARDFTNSRGSDAVADVVVGDKVLIKDAPAPYLLWLDKQLDDLTTFIAKLPTLDPGSTWDDDDEVRGISKSNAVKARREVRRPAVKVIFPPDQFQPGSAHVYDDTAVVGTWTRHKFSGAIHRSEKAKLMLRVMDLRHAVGAARQSANRVEAVQPSIGEPVLAYLFD